MAAVEGELTGTTAPADAPLSTDAIPLRLRRRGGSPRQVLAITLIGTLVLAALASRDLATWTERLGDGRVAQTAQSLAAGWDGAMAKLGLVRPHEGLRFAIHWLLDREWPAIGIGGRAVSAATTLSAASAAKDCSASR